MLWNLPFILYLFNVVDVFEYSKIVVLNYDVFFKFDFSPHTNV
jgi:hypothetical protein